jgi:type II secretory pathway component GspD/PulD (secretin)
MTRLKGVITALAALALACSCTRADDDEYSVKEKPVVPAVTNAAVFVAQATNDAVAAMMPKGMLYKDDVTVTTNKDEIAISSTSTNVVALLEIAAKIPEIDSVVSATNDYYTVSNGVAKVVAAEVASGTTNAMVVAEGASTNVLAAAAIASASAGVQASEVTNIVQAAVADTVKQAALDAVVEAVNAVNTAADKVAATERRHRISTRTFKLNYASANEVAERFNTMWSGDFGTVWKVSRIAQAFPEANAVMVTAPGVILDACEQAIAAIDVEPKQVYIEARFVELQNSAVHKLGIDWSMLDGMGGTASFGGGIDRRNIGNAVQSYSRTLSKAGDTVNYSLAGKTSTKTSSFSETKGGAAGDTSTSTSSSTSTNTGRDGGVTYFSGTLSFTDMSLVLSALDTSGDAKIFSNPKIIVASGKQATVDMTEKYPNVAIAAKRTLNGNAESLDLDMKMVQIPGEDKLMFAKEAFFSWGISLEVTPRVTSNNFISVSIVPTISEKSGEVTVGSDTTPGSRYPIISVQRLVTDFSLKAGSTAVIGGLSKTTEEQVDTGIPWLREIPWIGDKLFGSKSRKKVQKEILVFVTVGMADPKDIQEDVGMPKNAVLGRMYTQGVKLEPGDRTGNAIEGIAALDKRPLDEQARDPLATNKVEKTTFLLPFGRESGESKDDKEEK